MSTTKNGISINNVFKHLRKFGYKLHTSYADDMPLDSHGRAIEMALALKWINDKFSLRGYVFENTPGHYGYKIGDETFDGLDSSELATMMCIKKLTNKITKIKQNK